MTGQIPDRISFVHEGRPEGGAIAAATGRGLYTPERYGVLLPPQGSTACWRGFVAHYRVIDDRLLLPVAPNLLADVLARREAGGRNEPESRPVPELEWQDDGTFRLVLRPRWPAAESALEVVELEGGPAIHIAFTGVLVVGSGLLRQYYVHAGFQAPWKYERGFELRFDDGRLLELRDVSPRLRLQRAILLLEARERDRRRQGMSEESREAERERQQLSPREALERMRRAYSVED